MLIHDAKYENKVVFMEFMCLNGEREQQHKADEVHPHQQLTQLFFSYIKTKRVTSLVSAHIINSFDKND